MKRNRLFVLGVVLLVALSCTAINARAEYLLQSARHFSTTYTEEPSDFVVEDVTADGILDMVIVSTFSEGYTPIVVTLPGLGDGTFADPVSTDTTLPWGNAHRLATSHLDDDQHLDIVLTLQTEAVEGYGVMAFLGNGDGRFTMTDHHELDHITYEVVAADFTGDGIADFAIQDREWDSKSVRLYQGAGDGTFTEVGTTSLPVRPTGLVKGDFDNDDDMDLAVGDNLTDSITVLLNDGTGTFSTQSYDSPEDPYTVASGDLNNDGCDDLVFGGGHYEEFVWVYFGDESGTLSPYVQYLAGDGVPYLTLGDLDDDGDLDLVANGYETEDPHHARVATLLNYGDGSFADPLFCFRRGQDITLGDMNGDGNLDAVMSSPVYMSVLPGLGDGTFMAMTDLLIDGFGQGVAQADVDLDGDMDVALSESGGIDDAVHVLRNNGHGSFTGPETYFTGYGPEVTIFADLTGDGFPEMIAANYTWSSDDGVSVKFNAGDGTFHDLQSFTVGYRTTGVQAGDLDGDDDLDLAACCDGSLGVLTNPGNGVFAGVDLYPAPLNADDLVLEDVDGDGDLDAVMNGRVDGDEGPALMTNNGDGSFAEPQLLGGIDFYGPAGLCLSDFDRDGDPDVAFGTGDSYGSDVMIMLNDGAGVFPVDPTPYPSGDYTIKLEACDLDWDGHIDLIAGNAASGDIAFLPGNGDGTFGPPQSYPLGTAVADLELADFNGDGSPDVLTNATNYISGSIFFSSLSSTSGLLATGPGRGEFNPTLVRVYGVSAGRNYTEWRAYGVDRWGVNVALGELDGSGSPDVLTGPGPGAVFGPHVRGFQHDGSPLPGISFLAYGTNKYGVNVCSGDLDNDGFDEIVTGAGPGAVFGPHVRGWNWDGAGTPTPIPGISYFAYGTPKWGVNVSCGDIDGDGFDEIVTGAGPGAVYGPHVRGWNCDGGGAVPISGVSFFAYGTLKYGVNVSCGDIDGDGIDEMVTGAGPGAVFGPHVRAWNWDGTGSAQSIPAVSFFAYDYTQWGVNVSCSDLDDDGIDEILTGPGPGETHIPRVRGWNYDGQSLTAMGGVDFLAYDQAEVTHGVKVAGVR